MAPWTNGWMHGSGVRLRLVIRDHDKLWVVMGLNPSPQVH